MNLSKSVITAIAAICMAGPCEAGNFTGPIPKPAPAKEITLNNPNESPNPYAIIMERNMFALRPEPPPPEPEAQKPDLPQIKISGFITVAHRRRALFAEVPRNPKDHLAFFNLAEGERSGILELLKISADEKEAEIVNSGARMMLTVKDDSFAPAAPSKPSAPPVNLRPRAPWRPPAPGQSASNYSPPRKRM